MMHAFSVFVSRYRPLLGGGLFLLLTQLAVASDQLRVNQQVFTGRSIALLLEMLQRDTPSLEQRQLLDSIVENHLMAEYARDHVGAEHNEDINTVGFADDVRIENQIISTFRALFAKQIHQDLADHTDGKGPAGLIIPRSGESADTLLAWLDPAPTIYQLNLRQLGKAERMTVARYALPGQPVRDISLAQIYQRQNVQGRMALHQQDRQWLDNETRLFVAQRYVDWWITHRSGLSQADRISISTFVTDRFIARQYLADAGVNAEMHHDNPALRQRAASISAAQIEHWYQQHRQRFTEVDSLDAWHIQCASREQCDRAYAALQAGSAFYEVAQTYSIATDAQQEEAGYLGRLRRGDSNLRWLEAVALMQPPGTASRPIQAPGSQSTHWEIVYTDNAEWFTHAVDSRTVALVARREIARQQMVTEFSSLQASLRAKASISWPAS